jgi:predicted O-linked N-acetylglucosamine transferase (SPINDLY family)
LSVVARIAGSAERARLLASLPGCAFIEQQSPVDDAKRAKASNAGSSSGTELKRESKRATAASAVERKQGSQSRRRIRLGFLCSDFVNHCTGDLVQSMFQHFT